MSPSSLEAGTNGWICFSEDFDGVYRFHVSVRVLLRIRGCIRIHYFSYVFIDSREEQKQRGKKKRKKPSTLRCQPYYVSQPHFHQSRSLCYVKVRLLVVRNLWSDKFFKRSFTQTGALNSVHDSSIPYELLQAVLHGLIICITSNLTIQCGFTVTSMQVMRLSCTSQAQGKRNLGTCVQVLRKEYLLSSSRQGTAGAR